MTTSGEHSGTAYWAAILAGTFVYDAWAISTEHETASSAMRRYTEQPWQKFLFCGVLGGLALHFLSEQYDVANLIFRKEEECDTGK